MTLEKIGLPDKIASKTAAEIVTVWREEVKRAVRIKKAQKLIEIASSSIGIREGLKMRNIR